MSLLGRFPSPLKSHSLPLGVPWGSYFHWELGGGKKKASTEQGTSLVPPYLQHRASPELRVSLSSAGIGRTIPPALLLHPLPQTLSLCPPRPLPAPAPLGSPPTHTHRSDKIRRARPLLPLRPPPPRRAVSRCSTGSRRAVAPEPRSPPRPPPPRPRQSPAPRGGAHGKTPARSDSFPVEVAVPGVTGRCPGAINCGQVSA